ncbi:MAG: hypothetical protein ACE5HE_03435, partial [Phycisphaerae bacterium]
FGLAGLVVVSAFPFITGAHARIWDIGLRPVAPMLVRMANALAPQTRASIKADWVELLRDVLTPLCDPNLHLWADDDEPVEIQYVLKPRKT